MAGLPKDPVANASQIVAVDRALLTNRVGKLPAKYLTQVMSGIDVVLGRWRTRGIGAGDNP